AELLAKDFRKAGYPDPILGTVVVGDEYKRVKETLPTLHVRTGARQGQPDSWASFYFHPNGKVSVSETPAIGGYSRNLPDRSRRTYAGIDDGDLCDRFLNMKFAYG